MVLFFNVYKKTSINFLRSVKLYILRIAEWTIVLHTWILCRFAFIFLWFRSKQLICHKSMLNNIAMPALKMTNDLMCTGPSSGSLHTLDRTITPSRQIYAHLGLGERWKRRTALERSEGEEEWLSTTPQPPTAWQALLSEHVCLCVSLIKREDREWKGWGSKRESH